MKQLLFVGALLLMAGLCNHAIAQTEAVSTIVVNIENSLLLEAVEDAAWGQVAPGQSYVVTPAGFKEPPGPGEAAGDQNDAAGFNVTGNAGAEVLITLVLPTAFHDEDIATSIPLSNWTYGWNYTDNADAWVQAGAVSGNAVTVRCGADGAAFLGLGASFSVPVTALEGDYTAQVIGSATYTGN